MDAEQPTDAAKLGARNSRTDKQRIRDMRKAARSIHDTTVEMEPEDEDGVITPHPVKGDLDIEADEAPVILGTVRAVKADSGEWLLDVLGLPFGGHNGGKDSDGEYFDAQTKTHEDKYGLPPAVYYHGYDEHGKPSGQPIYIGKTVSREKRADGWWFRVVLDKASQYAKRVWDAAQKQLARASSGSIAHLVRKEKGGRIAEWPVAELSIFDTGGKRQPANQYAVALPVMKAIYQEAGLPFPDDIPASQPEADARGALANAQRADAAKGANVNENNRSGVLNMEKEEVVQLVTDSVTAALKAQADAAADAAKREADEKARIDAALKAQADQFQAELQKIKDEAAEARRLPMGNGAPYQAKFSNLAKYDGMEAADMAVMYGVLAAAKRSGRSEGPSEDLRKAMAIAIVEAKDENGSLNAAKAQLAFDLKGTALKANELNQSTLANFGDEWVGVTYSTQLWSRIVLPTTIVGKIPTLTVPQGSESIIIPLESAPPTFYKVAQASAQSANPGRVTPTVITSKMGTAQQTLTVSKLGAAVNYTGELEEDSMIPWASELRRSMTTEAQEVLEHIVIDGDTEAAATTNINDIGGTPAGNEPFMLFNGFRKLALVTNTANSRSGGALDITDFLETVKLLGLAGRNAQDKSKVSLIVGSWVNWAMLNLTQLQTQDVYSQPTIETGRLTGIYGYEVLSTSNMHRANQDATYGYKANTAGKVDLDTAANNTTDSILAVRWDQWRLGWKRRMTFEIERDAISDSTAIVVMMRVGMVYRDTEASAISYGITGI